MYGWTDGWMDRRMITNICVRVHDQAMYTVYILCTYTYMDTYTYSSVHTRMCIYVVVCTRISIAHAFTYHQRTYVHMHTATYVFHLQDTSFLPDVAKITIEETRFARFQASFSFPKVIGKDRDPLIRDPLSLSL